MLTLRFEVDLKLSLAHKLDLTLHISISRSKVWDVKNGHIVASSDIVLYSVHYLHNSVA